MGLPLPIKRIEKVVYFVRHGQSVGNVDTTFQSFDSPLNENGKAQATEVADRISRLEFEALLSSPQARAKGTSEIISEKTKITPEFSDLFIERIKPTSIQGKDFHDTVASETWKKWEKSLRTTRLKVEDGENFDEIVSRAEDALNFLLEKKEQHIVVVTHGYFLRTIVAKVIFGETVTDKVFGHFHARAAMENTGITVLRYENTMEGDMVWKLWIYNDHAHLG